MNTGSRLTPILELEEAISVLRWSADANHLYIGTRGLQHATLTDGHLVFLPPSQLGITAAAWSDHPALVAAGSACGQLVVAGGEVPWRLDLGGWIHDLCWKDDLLAVGVGERLAVYDAHGHLVRDYPFRPGPITAVCWSNHRGARIIAGTVGGLECYDPADTARDRPVSVSHSPGAVSVVRPAPDGRAAACGDVHGDCRVLFLETDHECVLHGFPGRTDLVGWTATGTHLCVVGGVELTIWEVGLDDVDTEPIVLDGHEQDITAMAVAPSDDLIATGDAGGTVSIWERAGDWELVTQLRCAGSVSALDWWAPGAAITIGTDSGHVYSFSV